MIALSATAVRRSRRALDLLLVASMVAVAVTTGITLLAPVLGGRAFVIGGGSMEPTIPQGALVLALPDGAASYRVGDVVTIQQGRSTPYTHRVTRLAELKGVPYVETKGDGNPFPDAAIVPRDAVIGRVVVSLPLLGYLSALLGTVTGLAGFLCLGATGLLLAWMLEELGDGEDGVRAGDGGRAGAEAVATGRSTLAVTSEAALGLHRTSSPRSSVASVLPGPRARVRESGRARDPLTPVRLECDRRNPRRHRAATPPVASRAESPASAPARTGDLAA
jgi:signal peptidase